MTSHRTRLDRRLAEASDSAVEDVHEAIACAMQQRKVTPRVLADRMDVTEEELARMLATGSRNMSIRGVARLFAALGMEIHIWTQDPLDETKKIDGEDK